MHQRELTESTRCKQRDLQRWLLFAHPRQHFTEEPRNAAPALLLIDQTLDDNFKFQRHPGSRPPPKVLACGARTHKQARSPLDKRHHRYAPASYFTANSVNSLLPKPVSSEQR